MASNPALPLKNEWAKIRKWQNILKSRNEEKPYIEQQRFQAFGPIVTIFKPTFDLGDVEVR